MLSTLFKLIVYLEISPLMCCVLLCVFFNLILLHNYNGYFNRVPYYSVTINVTLYILTKYMSLHTQLVQEYKYEG